MKTCNLCGKTKDLSEFYPKGLVGISSNCKECNKARTLKNRRINGSTVRANDNASAKARRERIKAATFAAYGGMKCSCCAETEPKFLTLDHIDNDGAQFRRAISGKRTAAGYITYRWLAKHGFPAGYQVLCMNCNHGKRMNGGVCPHQARRNDQSKDVGPSGPKRIAPMLKVVG